MLDQFEDGFPEDEQEYKSFLHPGESRGFLGLAEGRVGVDLG